MKKLKQLVQLSCLGILLLSTNCGPRFRTYILENNTGHEIEIDFFTISRDLSGVVTGTSFSGKIHLPDRGSLWEFTVDISRGGGAPSNAFADFFEGGRSSIDSATVTYNGDRIEVYILNTTDIDRNLFYNESNIISGDEHRYIFTEEDYNNAEVIEE